MTTVQMFQLVVTPILLLLVAAVSWNYKKMDAELKEVKKKADKLETDLLKDYYDKHEISKHWDDRITPLKDSLAELSVAFKTTSAVMSEIHQDMAILKYKILGEELVSINAKKQQ